MSKIFTPDEISVVTSWAVAYLDEHPLDNSIGSDKLHPGQLAELELKLRTASCEIMLGTLNTCFLMGFDTFKTEYPLAKWWTPLRDLFHRTCTSPIERGCFDKLTAFLKAARLIP